MTDNKHRWATYLARFMVKMPALALAIGVAITVVSIILASKLEMKTDWKDLLPEENKVVKLFDEIEKRFGNPAGLVVVLEGDYDRIVELAKQLEPRLNQSSKIRNVMGQIPLEFFKEHGFVLLKPDELDRGLKSYSASDLVGVFKGMNGDYEGEYTDSESNLRRDEVKVAQSLLGIKRTLDILNANLAGIKDAPPIEDAVNAMMLGEPWILSLDRRMLMILCDPHSNIADVDEMIATSEQAETLLDEFRPKYPDVEANLTGLVKIGQDEMNSLGTYTLLLSLLALALIYLLLARSFHNWLLPVVTLIPLGLGIIWTNGLLYILFGSLNQFTAMMMLVLIGLGIDFSIHMVSRFVEEIGEDTSMLTVLERMYGGTGVGVMTGALTTAAAFLTLMVGETKGVHEFGAAAGFGVLLTLASIFLTLPPLLILIYGKKIKNISNVHKLASAGHTPFLGKIAVAGWRRNGLFLAGTVVVLAASFWAMQHIEYEYDWMELEPEGLRSVELQREIPIRFGMSDHPSFVVAKTIEESRELKEGYMKLGMVADVTSISDYIPPAERLAEYQPKLDEFRHQISERQCNRWFEEDQEKLQIEINRLWDNLDLMSNLAFMSGLDRIVRVVDMITGTKSETGEVDKSAILPTLVNTLDKPIQNERMERLNKRWFNQTQDNLYSLSNPTAITVDELPENVKTNLLPKTGDGFLLHITPRTYLWQEELLHKFIEQTSTVSENTTGSEHMMTVMMVETLKDGKKGAQLALIVISLLVLIHFRGLTGLLALIPLAGGAMAMIGLMYLFGMKYNYMNLISVPIILGIGIDDGIHILHRFRARKHGGVKHLEKTFSTVGRAIMLTTLTTMIGFGSIALYSMKGMASFGLALFLGVGTCFVATVFILPAVLRLVFGRKREEE